MHMLLVVVTIVSACMMIALVLIQRGQSDGLSEAITGGAEQLFSKQKARGIEVGLNRLTIFFSVLFFLAAFLLGYYFK
ncbi:MAG: preprotein translocase subunit SecG [Sporolactobacillus sp.]